MDYEKYMQMAIDEAKRGVSLGQRPFGAVLFGNGKVLAVSHSETVRTKDHSNHAEIVALRKYLKTYKYKPSDLTLITTCEPCANCYEMAIQLGVKNFVYGSSIRKAIYCGLVDIDKIPDKLNLGGIRIIPGVLQKECNKLLEDAWLKNNVVSFGDGNPEEQHFMKQALQVARRGMEEKGELPIGVLIVAGNNVLSEASTMTYTLNSPIPQGELWALIGAQREIYSTTLNRPLVLYSTLEPHLLGFAAAIEAGVDKVVFGLESSIDGGSCYLPHLVGVKEKLPIVVGGVLEEEEYALLQEFLNQHPEDRMGYNYAKKLVKSYQDKKK